MKKYRIPIICIVILIACLVFAQPPIQPILNFFLDLDDTPSDYTGEDGKVVKVDEANNQLIFEAESGAVEDDAYGAGWNGDTTNAPSQNAVYDILHSYDTDDDGDIDNIDGAVGGGDITGVGPGALAAGDAWTDGYVTTGTTLLIWEGTTDDGAEFSIIVPEDPGADIVITMPTATATLNAAGDITGTDAGTDLTVDLEEEVTEGSLADSTIVSADIKNGEVTLVDLAVAAYAKDLVATSPLTINAGANVDNILVGADGDITIAIADADDDGATKGAASFDNTDFDVVGGNVTINDDGHAHTGASVTGIAWDDIADSDAATTTSMASNDHTYSNVDDFTWTSGTTSKPDLLIINTNDDTTAGSLTFQKAGSTPTPADSDYLGTIIWKGDDSAGNPIVYVQLEGKSEEVDDGDEAGAFHIKVLFDDGTPNLDDMFCIFGDIGAPGTGKFIWNQDSQDMDYRMETDDEDHFFYIDGGANWMRIGDWDTNYTAIAVDGTITQAGTATITSAGNITAVGSFVIGGADMDQTDLEKLDGITNGTAAASKALVLDAGSDITSGIDVFTATNFSGGGGSLTSVDAATGDSATAFFDAGTIEHERGGIEANISAIADGGVLVGTGAGTMGIRASFLTAGAAGFIKHELGGLEADINAYTGLVAISGGSTAEIDSLDELEGQLADVTRIVSEAVMPVAGTDPDVDAAGELSVDTDGGNEPNSVTLRTFMGTDDQAVFADTLKHYNFSVAEPDNLAEADFHPVWKNRTGFTFIITAIHGESDIDDFDFTLKERDADGANVTTIEAVQLSTDGTAMYYGSVIFADIDHTTIEAGHTIGFDKSADDAKYVLVIFSGYYEANVD